LYTGSLECHIINLLFTKAFCKSRLSCAETEVYHNVWYHNSYSHGLWLTVLLFSAYFVATVTRVPEALCEAKEMRGEKEEPLVTSVANPTSTLD
jgi:hypothetical protein